MINNNNNNTQDGNSNKNRKSTSISSFYPSIKLTDLMFENFIFGCIFVAIYTAHCYIYRLCVEFNCSSRVLVCPCPSVSVYVCSTLIIFSHTPDRKLIWHEAKTKLKTKWKTQLSKHKYTFSPVSTYISMYTDTHIYIHIDTCYIYHVC